MNYHADSEKKLGDDAENNTDVASAGNKKTLQANFYGKYAFPSSR